MGALVALLFGIVLYNRGCGFAFGIPSIPRAAKVALAAVAASLFAAIATPSGMLLHLPTLVCIVGVGAATAGAFSLGHSAILTLFAGWSWAGASSGLLAGGALGLPLALLLGSRGDCIAATIAMAGPLAMPLCYRLAGRLVEDPENPDPVACALHAVTSAAVLALATLVAG